jgi:hypothetical protein
MGIHWNLWGFIGITNGMIISGFHGGFICESPISAFNGGHCNFIVIIY